MDDGRQRITHWVAREVLPHEGALRKWLSARAVPAQDAEDIMQECYCRIAGLTDVSHIRCARTYLFATARRILIDQLRRARIVRIETLTEIESDSFFSDDPSPERITSGRRELARVLALLDMLPERTRRIIEMRKVQGLSQSEIAHIMGVSQNVVENEVSRGQRKILTMIANGESSGVSGSNFQKADERARIPRRD